MSKFYIGQTVLCINGNPNKEAIKLFPNLIWPETGRFYRVRGILPPEPVKFKHGVRHIIFILLHGLYNQHIRYISGINAEAGFWEERFEPAADIDGLRNILKDVPIKQKEDA
jgi:hypothetical protein